MARQFALPRFYPILDTGVLSRAELAAVETAQVLLDAGTKILQFRHKDDWTQREYDEAARIAELCHEAGCLCVVNDRADYAHLTGSALHIGQDDLSPVAARKVVGDAVIGLSTHNRRQIEIGEEEDVDYLALGPVFPTRSKLKPDPVLGIEKFAELRKATQKALVAIGGITVENAREVLDAGAASVATVFGFLPAEAGLAAIAKSVRAWVETTNR